MKLTIRHSSRLRDAWVFWLSFLLIFPIGSGLLSINLKSNSLPKAVATHEMLLDEQFEEVGPPELVQNLRNKLSWAVTSLEIMKPISGDVIPKNPWYLHLNLKDWSNANNQHLPFSNHLVVQIDNSQPLRINSTQLGGDYLQIRLPELLSGEHHLSIFSAFPWGESIKSPGTYQHIILHRNKIAPKSSIADNPWLILVSPSTFTKSEPILVDWLLWNTPLQALPGQNMQSHLRISINGNSFLIDRSTPLWLKGFSQGSNLMSIEIVNEKGEPIPTTSISKEINIDSLSESVSQYNLPVNLVQLLNWEPVIRIQSSDSRINRPIDIVVNPKIQNEIRVVPESELEKMLFYEEFLSKYFGEEIKNNKENIVVHPIKVTPIFSPK
uniref:Proline-rich region n=1 Tax=Paulinella longichromatophora TaxID=1708747 RepID=A0A2H4ZPT7_9EUKA|nr:Proline-rich region [Paulinella longichromatophora]